MYVYNWITALYTLTNMILEINYASILKKGIMYQRKKNFELFLLEPYCPIW